jgi:ethanolamine phosphate transferase 2 subunit G
MKSYFSKVSCLLSNALVIGSILVFAVGFFPHKAFLPGLATWSDRQDGSTISAPFDKVIFMVVDALRRQDIRPLRIGFITTDNAQ